MGGATTIIHVWVVEVHPVETLLESFQRFLLGRVEMTEVAREQLGIIGSVNIWVLKFGHVLVASYPITTEAMTTFDHLWSCHCTFRSSRQPYLFPTADRNLSITAFPFRRFSNDILSFGRCAWSYPQNILNKSAHREAVSPAHRTLAKREMQSMTAEFFFEVWNRRDGLPHGI